MITLITGAPGTGKTNALVSLLETIGKDRAIYVFGIPDLKVKHEALDDPTTWPDTVPDGSAIVLDEVQNVWRPRGPGQKVPEHVAKLETHRHRGLDFYIITQGPNLVDANVRALVGRHIHLRDLGILGRWWYEWPECADNCRTGWKNAPIKKRYRLDKAAQANYKSASIHVKPVRSVPWMLAVMVLALLAVAFTSWKAYDMISAKVNPKPAGSTATPGAAASGAASGSASTVNANGQAGAAAPGQPPAKFIDDRVDFIPRISSRPDSAPAFDHLRTVVAMPRIVGGMVMGKRARCFTQQGTDAGVSEEECRQWLANPPFDPYSAPSQAQQAPPATTPQNAPQPEQAPALVRFDGPGWRDPQSHRTAGR